MNIHDIMDNLAQAGGSDIHIVIGSPPTLRIDGDLIPVEGAPVLGEKETAALIAPLMTQEQADYVTKNKELDFGYQFKDVGRFRVNVYHSMGAMAAALRLIPNEIKRIDDLMLPPVVNEFNKFSQGLVLVTGPTGEGKSTTLASLIDDVNQNRAEHIVTIEDPIEFVYKSAMSVVSQREVNFDTIGWDIALRSVLREDPDVVLIGEMRDVETIAAAITIAETGHLVFATLHTATAAQTIDRIIDVFPAAQQGQIRQQLAGTLQVVCSQRLLPKVGGGRVAAMEVMFANGAIRNLIRDQKTHQIDTVIQTSAESGMMMFESHLQQLIQQGLVTAEDAKTSAFRPAELERLIGAA